MIKPVFTEADIPYENKEGWDNSDGMLDRYNFSPARSLYPILKDGVYHRCSLKNCVSILTDEFIMPNDGSFDSKFPNIKRNHGLINNWICLFDFMQDPFNIYSAHHSWHGFFFDFKPVTIIFKLDRCKLPKMIPNSYHGSNKDHKGVMSISFVETWYPEPIPISHITDFIIVLSQFDPVKYVMVPSEKIFSCPPKSCQWKSVSDHFPNVRIANLYHNVRSALQKRTGIQENST